MNEKDPVLRTGPKDRRLGDEWLDWNGTTSPEENEIDEKMVTFLALALGSVLILIGCLQLGWYLAKPRIDQLSPLLSSVIQWSAILLGALLFILVALEATLLLRFGTSLFPYVWTEWLLLALLAKSMWLGEKLGISRDRVGNSFIKANNVIVKSHARHLNADRLLILLPRCLLSEAKQQVVERANGRTVRIVTVGGGEEARKAIKEYNASLILAVACERDLISGIRDVAERIPVLAIPNKRPEGPCKNTELRLDALEDALSFLNGRAGRAAKR